jgi:uncharacterized DUF497 family protein
MGDNCKFLDWEGFDWDEGNLLENREKHGVSASGCEQIFFNNPLIAGLDAEHSRRESRYYALGITDAHKKLFIAFAVQNKLIRVISARDMSRKERKVFDRS